MRILPYDSMTLDEPMPTQLNEIKTQKNLQVEEEVCISQSMRDMYLAAQIE